VAGQGCAVGVGRAKVSFVVHGVESVCSTIEMVWGVSGRVARAQN